MEHETVKATSVAKFNQNTIIYDRAKANEAKRVTTKLFKIFDADGDGKITDCEIHQVDKLDGKTPKSIDEMRKKALEHMTKMLEDQYALSGRTIPKCPEQGEPKELCLPSEESKKRMEVPESVQKTFYPSLSSWDIQCQASDCKNNPKAQIDPEATKFATSVNAFKQLLSGSPDKNITKNDAILALSDKNTLNAMKVFLGEKKPPKTLFPAQTPFNVNPGMGMGLGTGIPNVSSKHPSHATKSILLDDFNDGNLVEVPKNSKRRKK